MDAGKISSLMSTEKARARTTGFESRTKTKLASSDSYHHPCSDDRCMAVSVLWFATALMMRRKLILVHKQSYTKAALRFACPKTGLLSFP